MSSFRSNSFFASERKVAGNRKISTKNATLIFFMTTYYINKVGIKETK